MITEKYANLFLEQDCHFAHCISADAKMGAGIAVEFQSRFRLREAVKAACPKLGDAILVNRVFNLITKKVYHGKPHLDTVAQCLHDMAQQCLRMNVVSLAMPLIGCGLDGLNWPDVRRLIEEEFDRTCTDITITSTGGVK